MTVQVSGPDAVEFASYLRSVFSLSLWKRPERLRLPWRMTIRRWGSDRLRGRSPDAGVAGVLLKVPEITVYFWIVKLLSTAMGEATFLTTSCST